MGGLYGISLVDGSFGHGCSKVACDPRRLSLKQALKLRERILKCRTPESSLGVTLSVADCASLLS
jgi:hypothetical protein